MRDETRGGERLTARQSDTLTIQLAPRIRIEEKAKDSQREKNE